MKLKREGSGEIRKGLVEKKLVGAGFVQNSLYAYIDFSNNKII